MLSHWRSLALLGVAILFGLYAGDAAAQVVADDVVCTRCVDASDIAKVEQVDGGLLLKPSPPPIRRKVYAMTKG